MTPYFTLQIFEYFDKTWGTQNMQRYFTLEISERFDKSWGHTTNCNAISLCKYQSPLIKHGGTRKNATLLNSANI